MRTPMLVTLTALADILTCLSGVKASTSSKASPSASPSAKPVSASAHIYDATVCGQNGYADDFGLSYSADAWNPDKEGFQCLSVISASSLKTSGFDATWMWSGDPDAVHSYPHVSFSSAHLPISVSNISSLRLAASWAYSTGTISFPHGVSVERETEWSTRRLTKGLDASGLSHVDTKANVAFDMFMDTDAVKATSATAAQYEMMIWIGRVGKPQPLGFTATNATCYTQQLGSLKFSLYAGKNSRGTLVYSWMSPMADQTSFDEDITPLLQYLWRHELVSADARVGLVEFGSEAYCSGANVTFSAGALGMQVWPGSPVKYALTAVPDHCAPPESPTGPQGTGEEKGAGVRAGQMPLAGFVWLTSCVVAVVASWCW